MTIKELLDAVKEKHGLKSDNALALALDVRRQRVSDYYKGFRTPDNYACKKIADMLEKPLDEIITVVELEAEKDETRREVWKAYYGRIGGIAAIEMETACTMAGRKKLVGREGVEPTTNGLRVRCSTN